MLRGDSVEHSRGGRGTPQLRPPDAPPHRFGEVPVARHPAPENGASSSVEGVSFGERASLVCAREGKPASKSDAGRDILHLGAYTLGPGATLAPASTRDTASTSGSCPPWPPRSRLAVIGVTNQCGAFEGRATRTQLERLRISATRLGNSSESGSPCSVSRGVRVKRCERRPIGRPLAIN